jgi:hypothetical protein
MTSALLSAIVLLASTAEPNQPDSAGAAKLRTAQNEFNHGDFLGALRTLDAAAAQTFDDPTLARIHLLRGQCYAARQDFVHAEQAFGKALEHDPEASLDPSKVDPAVVRLIDTLRAKLHGELRLSTDKTPAQATLDGKPLGAVPLRTSAPIGRHIVEVRTTDGRLGARQEVLIRPNRTTEEVLALVESLPEKPATQSKTDTRPKRSARDLDDAVRPFADLRFVFAPFASSDEVGVEVGGGVESGHLHTSVHANLYPSLGLTLRGGLSVPITDVMLLYVSIEAPFVFRSPAAVGFGGAGGTEYLVSRWFGLFGELGVRHFFAGLESEPNRFVIQAGTRLRLP